MSLKRVVQAMTVCAVLGSTHTYAEERNWDKMEQRMAAQEEAIRQLTERLKQYETTNQRLQEVGYQQEKEEKPLVQLA